MSSSAQTTVKSSQEVLNVAGNLVDKFLKDDHTFYDLSGLLGIATDKRANVSGNLDSAYPALNSSLPALAGMPFLGDIDHTPLPQELLQEFENMQCNSAMGLMPLIKRAWLTIDSTIYVWNYENGRDLAYFDGLKEVILGVGLIIPKANIFQDHIQYLLCLTTPQEIVILGVSFANSNLDPFGEMHLLPEPLFALPTDNTCMLDIVGTCTGRIFMGGKDGSLYEILYQAEEGWFSRKCRKINHSTSILSYVVPAFLSFSEEDPIVQIVEDGKRNILYTRSEKGMIRVYDLGVDGDSLSEVARISMDTIRYRALEACAFIGVKDRNLFKTIVHISVIPLLESSTLHLLAVTQFGVRLYFTTTPQGQSRRPSLISLVHVRFPPGYCPSNAAMKPGNTTHQVFYRRGCLLLACSQSEDRDTIWLVEPDSFPFQCNLMELFVTYPLNGRTWAMAESIEPGELEVVNTTSPLPPTIVTQHAFTPRKFILLSTEGSYILTKPRPVDQLRVLLDKHKTGCCEPIEAFFHLHGDAQACAMCLILAIGPNKEIAQWAAEAYLKFGGEPHFVFPTTLGPGQPVGGASPQPYQSPVGTPQQSSYPASPYPLSPMGNTLGRPVMGPEVQLSGKHHGMCLYISRLLSQLWNIPISYKATDNRYYSMYDSNQLSVLAEQLLLMKEFLDNNISFFTPPSTSQQLHTPSSNVHQRLLKFMRPHDLQTNDPQNVQQSMLSKYKVEAYSIEHNSLQSVHLLLIHCCECLSLLKLICEHQFEHVANGVEETNKNLLGMTFRNFVTEGKELSSALIKSLFSQCGGDSTISDSLIARLRQLSPSLFSQDDAISSKAQEMITLAMALANPVDKVSKLRDSLKLYSQVVGSVSLEGVSEQYRSLRYHEGIVELALCTAGHYDPQNMGLHFYKSGQPPEDTYGQEAMQKRRGCYDVVTNVLGQLLSQARNVSSPSVPSKPGPPPAIDDQKPDAMKDFNNMLTLCLRSDDELFHVMLYSWLLSDTVKMADKLVEIQSPYIEEFLQYTATLQHQDGFQVFDLLWKYYEKNKNYLAAARILDQLAHIGSQIINLNQRLDYLSRAVMCAKSSGAVTSVSGEGEFLHELEEKMEVARVQLSILQCIKRLPSSIHTDKAIEELNIELMDVSKLYGDYAEPFDMPECKLAIVHLAGHHDPTLIETLWREIIDQELESTLQQNNEARMASLREKLIQLGQLYSRKERYFPVVYLIKLLEQHCCQLRWRAGLIPQVFHTIGVAYPNLFSVYHTMFSDKESFWQAAGRPLYVLLVIVSLVSSIASHPTDISSYKRSSFLANILDKVGGYLVELQTLNPTTPDLTQITNDLRDLERRISIAMKT